MDVAEFEHWALIGGISLLIGYMGFIMWDLAKKSEAGRFGTLIIFLVLGLGVLGFIIKTVIIEAIKT
jgi:formate hydrogenlyase subunit 3/multisubunit Na+/H+ antiporter MnhD subunit